MSSFHTTHRSFKIVSVTALVRLLPIIVLQNYIVNLRMSNLTRLSFFDKMT